MEKVITLLFLLMVYSDCTHSPLFLLIWFSSNRLTMAVTKSYCTYTAHLLEEACTQILAETGIRSRLHLYIIFKG